MYCNFLYKQLCTRLKIIHSFANVRILYFTDTSIDEAHKTYIHIGHKGGKYCVCDYVVTDGWDPI